MGFSVQLDDDLWRHGGVDYLAQISGEVKYTALGRLANLWKDCIDKLEESRTEEDIDRFAGWFNPERGSYAIFLVKAGFAKSNGDGMFRILGVGKKMQWLAEFRDNKSAAGKASAKARAEKNGTAIPSGAKNSPRQNPEQTPNSRSGNSEQPLNSDRTAPNTTEPSVSVSVFVPVLGSGSVAEKKEERAPQSGSASLAGKVSGLEAETKGCCSTWSETRAHFKLSATVPAHEVDVIRRAVRKHGAFAVDLVLFGARFEESVEGFIPKKNVSAWRVLEGPEKAPGKNFGKLFNLGDQKRAEIAATRQAEANKNERQRSLDGDSSPKTPEQIRALMAGAFHSLPEAPGGNA